MSDQEKVDAIWSRVQNYTMIGRETAESMYRAAKLCVDGVVPGALVECGVWKGGSLFAGMLAFMELEGPKREVWAYDTFTGMPQPGLEDGVTANKLFKTEKDWCLSTLDEFEANLETIGYPGEKVFVVEGPVEETIPLLKPEQIAVLRLDTDWYSSTKLELEQLYPILSPGGVMIVDDYEAWPGCKQAVNEYFNDRPPQMEAINWTARFMRKPY